ncbi:MAG TPA: ribonuclease E inhibitor RraB [Gaiellaceae bacterium]|jgi:rhodanese-related sulfurtransferase|nr:ribonuclease E inhibitor RraB [Gaiellaceae bacterium]
MGFFRRKRKDAEATLNVVSKVEDPADADGLVLDQLQAMGVNLSKPRDARFYLYLRTREDAQAAAAAVRAQGFAVEVTPAAGEATEHPWLMLASRDMIVSADSIAEARRLFDGLAEQHSADYDGWEAAAD